MRTRNRGVSSPFAPRGDAACRMHRAVTALDDVEAIPLTVFRRRGTCRRSAFRTSTRQWPPPERCQRQDRVSLSVIVATTEPRPDLVNCLAVLEPQVAALGGELIVGDGSHGSPLDHERMAATDPPVARAQLDA